MTREVHLNIGANGAGQIVVDGEDLADSVRGVSFTSRARQVPVVRLDLMTDVTVVDGEARVEIPASTAAALVHLGWTPPVGES